jgi:hypothetical protein
MIAVDIFRIEDGKVAEHWDVMQEEAVQTASGHPMFPSIGCAPWSVAEPFGQVAVFAVLF